MRKIGKNSFILITCLIVLAIFISVAAAEGQPRLLMLTQPICPSCMAVKRVLDDVQNEYFVEVDEFNVREDMSVARKYGMTKAPLLVFFNENEEEIGKRDGLVLKEEIMAIFKEAGVQLEKK